MACPCHHLPPLAPLRPDIAHAERCGNVARDGRRDVVHAQAARMQHRKAAAHNRQAETHPDGVSGVKANIEFWVRHVVQVIGQGSLRIETSEL